MSVGTALAFNALTFSRGPDGLSALHGRCCSAYKLQDLQDNTGHHQRSPPACQRMTTILSSSLWRLSPAAVTFRLTFEPSNSGLHIAATPILTFLVPSNLQKPEQDLKCQTLNLSPAWHLWRNLDAAQVWLKRSWALWSWNSIECRKPLGTESYPTIAANPPYTWEGMPCCFSMASHMVP